MSLASNTIARAAAAGVVVLPVLLVGAVYAVAEPAGGIPFGPELALIMAAETFFICALVQFVLLRMKKASRAWYAAGYGVPFALAGIWFSTGSKTDPIALLAVMALTGGIGAALGLAQWVIVVWRNAALLARHDKQPTV